MLRLLCVAPLFTGCLERVTGEAIPLDARFTAQALPGQGQGDDTGTPGHTAMEHKTVKHVEVPPPMPFQDLKGDRVEVSGTISSVLEGPVDLDVSRIDPQAEGGLKREGKILLSQPGPFELQVPVSLGGIQLSAFQDLEKDGPTNDDPYVELSLNVEEADISNLALVLVEGGRKSAAGGPEHQTREHFDAPPGYGSEQSGSSSGQATDGDPFDDHEGERVLVSGTLVYDGSGVIDMDLFQEDASAPGGRILLGKLKKFAGSFELQVPVSLDSLELDAFVDMTGDGPSGDDPRGSVRGIQVSSGPVSGVVIALKIPEEKPKKQAADIGGTDLEEEFARTRVKGKEISSIDEGL